MLALNFSRTTFLYSSLLAQSVAANEFRGLAGLGSASRLWMDRRTVCTL